MRGRWQASNPGSDGQVAWQWDIVLSVVGIGVIIFLFAYNRQPYAMLSWLAPAEPHLLRTHEEYLLVNCLLLLLPLLLLLSCGKETEPYLLTGGNRWGWIMAGGCYLLMLPLLWWAAGRADFQQTYPLYRFARQSLAAFGYHLLTYTFYLWCWEMFFRGVLTSIGWRRLGWLGVALQAAAFALLHFGKPSLEVAGSLIAGLVLAWIAIRARSFLPGFACHALVSATMDVFVLIRG